MVIREATSRETFARNSDNRMRLDNKEKYLKYLAGPPVKITGISA
jgi:hypothetical protein